MQVGWVNGHGVLLPFLVWAKQDCKTRKERFHSQDMLRIICADKQAVLEYNRGSDNVRYLLGSCDGAWDVFEEGIRKEGGGRQIILIGA